MTSKIIAPFLLLFMSTIVLAAPVSNPVEDYLSTFALWLTTSHSKELITFRVDLNGDGQDEIFMTNDIRRHFRAGYSWTIYI